MKIASDVLSRFIEIPSEARQLRLLLDDLGLEVKRIHTVDNCSQITLELLANRGDHHSYLGIATEIRGRTGHPIHIPEYSALEVAESVEASPYPLKLETSLCGLYSATLLTRSQDSADLPEAALRLLEASDIHSLGAVIDATNLANLEFGQPTHAFDADTLVGPISIRESLEGEQAWPLFSEKKVHLPVGTLVIADDEKILAIAGVIGCEESKTTVSTTRVLLESAAFDPIAVRKASRALLTFTDSSARFERGSDPSKVLVGAGRVVKLLTDAGWELQGKSGLCGDWKDPNRCITLDVAAANKFLATQLGADEIEYRLQHYGFSVSKQNSQLQVTVPPHRIWDVEFAADLYEEIAKSLGYNDTPEHLPPVDMGALPTPAEIRRDRVDDILVGQGFYEVITDGFYSGTMREKLRIAEGHPLWSHINTTNALDKGYSFLKNNALAQAVSTISDNLRVKNDQIKAYEWTRTFHPDSNASNGTCSERKLLWGICCGLTRPRNWDHSSRAADAFFVKGILEEIATDLNLPLEICTDLDSKQPLSSCLHPNRQANILLNNEIVGIIGEIHADVLKSYKIKRVRPCYFEIMEQALIAESQPPHYVEPPDTHPVDRELAFTLPHRQQAGDLLSTLTAEGPAWLTAAHIIDRFDHEQDGQPVRTITFSLRYSNQPKTRTAEEINGATEQLIAKILELYGDKGVTLRG